MKNEKHDETDKLTQQFCNTANTLTLFYKTSLKLQKKAYENGKTKTLEGIFIKIKKGIANFIKSNSSISLNNNEYISVDTLMNFMKNYEINEEEKSESIFKKNNKGKIENKPYKNNENKFDFNFVNEGGK
jgi:hypothetical protein